MSEKSPIFYYQKRLRAELVDRIDRNPRYSLRSFATGLGLNSSDLSQILAGKRSVSTQVVDRILNYLELTSSEQKKFLESVIEEKKQKGLKRVSPALRSRLRELAEVSSGEKSETSIHGIGLEEFRVIADWYHYAILELTTSIHFQNDVNWIARELNITVIEAKLAVERMLELELLESVDGTLKKTNFKIDTKDKTKTSHFHRRRQKQVLEKSIHSLEHDPIEERNHSGITLCLDPKHLPEAKIKIQSMMWELSKFLISGKLERVYELNVNLFPLQKSKENRK